ncbi:hypothetical protein QBC38DRAFT_478969 [Podospora fimiseda]|uniref:Uncharacterized protein n=1 Tax=Podospora fimiseda TaxID=252190 RepID=A0AAN7BP81_9PEZI|nr:hypothetical protein QBC38DRAFT_478969 [Podospora fimiseda]
MKFFSSLPSLTIFTTLISQTLSNPLHEPNKQLELSTPTIASPLGPTPTDTPKHHLQQTITYITTTITGTLWLPDTTVTHTLTNTDWPNTPLLNKNHQPPNIAPTTTITKTLHTTVTPPPPPPPPIKPTCTYDVTATQFFTSGCPVNCKDYGMDGCWYDMPVTIPCGCEYGDVNVITTTVCARQSPCVQCMTGWGFATVNATGCSGSYTGVPTCH